MRLRGGCNLVCGKRVVLLREKLMGRVRLEDLLAAESEVLKRIAADLESESSRSRHMAGHNSMTYGHNSSGTHTSHSSGVTSASVPPTKSNDEKY